MFDTLYIGCSHSTGVYDLKNNIIDTEHSIATVIADKLNLKMKSFSMPGCGNFQYLLLLEYLLQHDKLSNIKNIIIQKTYEPRLHFHENEKEFFKPALEYMDNDNEYTLSLFEPSIWSTYEHMNVDVITGFQKTSVGKNDALSYLEWLHTCLDRQRYIGQKEGRIEADNLYADMCFRAIENLCKVSDINLYPFAWNTSYRDTRYIRKTNPKFMGVHNSVMDYLKDKYGEENLHANYLSNPGWHPTRDIVDDVGEAISKSQQFKGLRNVNEQ